MLLAELSWKGLVSEQVVEDLAAQVAPEYCFDLSRSNFELIFDFCLIKDSLLIGGNFL